MSKKLSKKELKELEALQAEAWINKWPTLKKDKDGNLVGCSEAEAGPNPDGPDSVEDVIDNIKEEKAEDLMEHFKEMDRLDEIRL